MIKFIERALAALLFLVIATAAYVIYNSAYSQSFTGTVQNHAVPIGKGPGVSGMTSLLPGASGTILRSNGASADPSYSSAAVLLDTICTTQGAFIYRNATVWGCLPPGTAGQPLLTGGAGANPSYGTLGVPAGGTGLTGGNSGGVPYFNTSNTMASSGALTTNRLVLGGGAGGSPTIAASLGTTTTVLHGNAAGAPTFGAVALTTDVSGQLPVGNGGTGLASGTSGGVPYFDSTSTMASSGALTANRLVLGGGAGATPTVVGSLGTTTTLLHGNAAGAPTFGSVSLTADVSGVLAEANGGTNQSTYAQGDLLYATASNTLGKLAKDTNATRYLSNTGTSNAPAWAQVVLSTGASDYVEGSWTPVIAGSTTPGTQTYTTQVGRYVQVGNQLTVFGRVTTSAIGGTIAGTVQITGLPATARNVANLLPSCSLSQIGGVTISATFFVWGMWVVNNSTTIQMVESKSAAAAQAVPVANLGAVTDLIFTCTYMK